MLSIITLFLTVLNRKGAFQRFRWTTTVKPAAAHKDRVLTKVSEATVRTGVEYRNLAVNADRETGDLPWGKWLVYPFVIAHKDDYYGRLYVLDGSVKTAYFVDGEPVDRDSFLALLTPSARKPRKPNGGCITVNLKNLEVL